MVRQYLDHRDQHRRSTSSRSPSSSPGLYRAGSLTIVDGFQRLEVWRLITFQFLHDPSSIWHVGMNMFGLWIFGPMVEQYLGGKKYLAFYLVCGLAGGLLFSILTVQSSGMSPAPASQDC